MLEEILMIVLRSVVPFLIGAGGVWFYYREKNQELAEALADKTAIVSSLLSHSDEIERQNVKQLAKKTNAKVVKERTKEEAKKQKTTTQKRKTIKSK